MLGANVLDVEWRRPVVKVRISREEYAMTYEPLSI
jgi:hypothetical protein